MKYLSIAWVERECGIAKDTLRVWERRYGFPVPMRDSHGDRLYNPDQVQKLKLIKQLMDRGHRPAGLVRMSAADLSALLDGNPAIDKNLVTPLAARVIEILQTPDHSELIATLKQRLAADGLMSFITEHLAPMNSLIGEAWAHGRISIAQEHLYTEIVQKVLRAYLLNLQAQRGHPRVLLATLPGEPHGLGLLMVECVLTASGAMPISIGTEVPLGEIVSASRSHRCDVVAISFSQARKPSFVLQGVKTLREHLAPQQELWIGGEGAKWLREPVEGVMHLATLPAIRGLLRARSKDFALAN